MTATRDGKRLDQTLAELWRFEDNRCVEVWAQFSDPEGVGRLLAVDAERGGEDSRLEHGQAREQ